MSLNIDSIAGIRERKNIAECRNWVEMGGHNIYRYFKQKIIYAIIANCLVSFEFWRVSAIT